MTTFWSFFYKQMYRYCKIKSICKWFDCCRLRPLVPSTMWGSLAGSVCTPWSISHWNSSTSKKWLLGEQDSHSCLFFSLSSILDFAWLALGGFLIMILLLPSMRWWDAWWPWLVMLPCVTMVSMAPRATDPPSWRSYRHCLQPLWPCGPLSFTKMRWRLRRWSRIAGIHDGRS